jgi:branched-chain amino acid transport system permease protein
MRYAGLIAVLFFATLPLWMRDPYFLHILITTGIFTIAAMSLNLLLGYNGQLSLGHVAFFGIGAYTSALVSLGFDVDIFGYVVEHEPWPALSGLFIATLLTAGVGYVIGKLSFKVRGAYFVILTVSFAEVTRLVALNWVDLTQGPLSLTSIPPIGIELPGIGSFVAFTKTSYYYIVLVAALLSFVLIRQIVQSRYGRAMIALKENELLAASCGIDVTRYLMFGTIVSAGMAGAAGALYAHYIRIIDPDIFAFVNTVTMVIMVITGGKGTLAGPIVGGLVFGILPAGLRDAAGPEMQWIIYGTVMIVICILLPEGIVPAVYKRLRSKRPTGVVPPASPAAFTGSSQ